MSGNVDYEVATRCPRDRIWPLYVAWHADGRYRPVFHELRWTEGEPWHKGSRLEVEMRFPFPFTVKQVITSSTPGEKVSWINHSMGMTVEQEITFTALLSGETRIACHSEFVGKERSPLTWPMAKLLRHVVVQALDSIRDYCDNACRAALD